MTSSMNGGPPLHYDDHEERITSLESYRSELDASRERAEEQRKKDLGLTLEAIGGLSIKIDDGIRDLARKVDECTKTERRIEALAIIFNARDVARDDATKRELRASDKEVRAAREEADELARRLAEYDEATKRMLEAKHSADDSTQRFALTSEHEIQRLSQVGEKTIEKIEATAEKATDKIDRIADRAIDKIEDEASDKVKAKKAERVELSRGRLAIVAIVVTAIVGGAMRLLEYAVTHQPPAPTHVEAK